MAGVVEKLSSVLREVDYSSVPPIAYHAVLLGQSVLPGPVLDAIIKFFNEQEKNHKTKDAPDDSDSIFDANEVEKIGKSLFLHWDWLAQGY